MRAERVRRAASGRGVGLRRDRLYAHPASVAEGHVHMAYARLVADLVDHELDARREAVHLEPVREWIEAGGSVRRDRR
jgi:hypothetical protein